MNKKLIITGRPRSGTGYTAKLFQANGFDIGHEKMGKHGTSNWCIASGSEKLLYGETCNDITVHQIRNPIDCIPSICGISKKAWRWIDQYCPVMHEKDIIKRSANFWINWNRMAEKISACSINVEKISRYEIADIIDLLGWKRPEKFVFNIPHDNKR